MSKYEVITDPEGNELVKRVNDNNSISYIPMDESNSDYQRYLRWLNGEEETQGGLN